MEKNYSKRVTRTLKFSSIYKDNGNYVGGGIANSTEHIDDEFWVEIMEDPVLDPHTDELRNTGILQVHIGSTRRALSELGTFLLALANYTPPKSGYTTHFVWGDQHGKPQMHMIFHLPVNEVEERTKFDQSINVASGIISYDGKQVVDTTLLPKDEERHDREEDQKGTYS